MRTAVIALITSLLTATGCAAPGPGRIAGHVEGCRSGFNGLPLSLEGIPGSSPERCRLLKDLTFVDRAGLVWKAEAGDITDGASIPAVFLTITGPRFERHFLPAAIVHDHYTDPAHLVRSWRATARVFYEAMRANRMPAVKAKLMYYAVYAFGPH